MNLAVEIFSMLADATRVRIILALSTRGELSVNHLADVVGKAPAAVSQHLAKLRLARVVTVRQDGTRAFYRLTDEHASRLVNEAIFQAEHALGGEPRHHHPVADEPARESVTRESVTHESVIREAADRPAERPAERAEEVRA